VILQKKTAHNPRYSSRSAEMTAASVARRREVSGRVRLVEKLAVDNAAEASTLVALQAERQQRTSRRSEMSTDNLLLSPLPNSPLSTGAREFVVWPSALIP
jgi:hypothetical protein